MAQEYVAIVPGSTSAPIGAYVAVVDASGNVISGSYGHPGGRLTLTTLVPVLTATVSASATVLYTPYNNDEVPIYNGTSWLMTQFAELTNTLSNATTNPAAAVANANYDLYVWNNAGVMTLSRGPLWSKTATVTTPVASPGVVNWTGHGLLAGTPVSFSGGVLPTGIVAGTTYFVIAAGLTTNAFEISATVGGGAINFTGSSSGTQTGVAGNDTARTNATDLTLQNGILLNTLAITNGPAALRGTYVGTIRTNATATADYNLGTASAAPATGALINVWNAYNRVNVLPIMADTTASWTYSSATRRSVNGAAGNAISFIRGLNEDMVAAYQHGRAQSAAVQAAYVLGLGLDSTTTITAAASGGVTGIFVAPTATNPNEGSPQASYRGFPGLGYHTLNALEAGDGVNTMTAIGASYQGMEAHLRA